MNDIIKVEDFNVQIMVPAKPNGKIPRCLLEDYQPYEDENGEIISPEQELINWLEQIYFWEKWNGKLEELNDYKVKARALAENKVQTLENIARLQGVTSRAVWKQMYNIYSDGWINYLSSVEDLTELLRGIQEKLTEGSGSWYEMKWVIEVFIPLMESLGYPKEMILSISNGNIQKAKASMSYINKIGKEMEDKDKISEEFRKIINWVIDPDVTKNEFIEKAHQNYGVQRRFEKAIASRFIGRDADYILIKTNASTGNAIETRLTGIVDDVPIRDVATIIPEITQAIMPKRIDVHLYSIKDNQLVQDGEGRLKLPSKEKFLEMLYEEYIKHRLYIQDILKEKEEAAVYVYRIDTFNDIQEWERLHYSLEEINNAWKYCLYEKYFGSDEVSLQNILVKAIEEEKSVYLCAVVTKEE